MTLYLLALVLAGLSGLPGLGLRKGGEAIATGLMVTAALCGLAAGISVLVGGGGGAFSLGSWGSLNLDPIAALFLLPVSLIFGCAAVYGLGYWEEHHENTRSLRAAFGVLAASLMLLVAADHAFSFLLGWEGMAIAAFVLVMAEDREANTRRAGLLYLVVTHTGTLCLFAAFALLAGLTGSFSLGPLPAGLAGSARGSAVFGLFLLGFGFKAGALPLHFWLPAAHAAAPTHVSAVMSGVMIKMGILGLVRLAAWVPDPPAAWGSVLVAAGAVSGILGVAMALGQHDLKRLLAYHSIENIGIILLGLGLGLLGKSTGHPGIQALGFAGALLHVVNHALFKGLLFLAAGSVLRATGTRDLEALGGLGRRMPGTALAFLAGAWAICGLPPLNGFASEFLIYLAAFRGLGHPRQLWSLAALAALALIGALALACFAKAFATAFLGHARTPGAAAAEEAPASMRLPMLVLVLACALIGLAPSLAVRGLAPVLAAMGGAPAGIPALRELSLISGSAALMILVAGLLALWARGTAFREGVPTWDCGYAEGNPRMQYSASSFAEGLLRGMRWVLWPSFRGGRLAGLFPKGRRFASHLPDLVLDRAAGPGAELAARGLASLRFLQAGHIPVYLLYVLLTLLTLFVWMVA